MILYLCFRSCSKCKWRKGRSAFRRSGRQDKLKITALYDIYEINTGVVQVSAGRKLQRWGFNPDRRCLLHTLCDHLLIKPPGHENDLLPCLDYRDRLHGLLTFLHRTLYQSFARMGLSKKLKTTLDQRLSELGLQRVMRERGNARSYRVQRSLFKEVGMSGEDKVQWMMILPHVIGHRALCLPEPLRLPVLSAISIAQVMVIGSRGLRSYTVAELQLIYDQGFLEFFAAIERIHEINHNRIYNKRMRKHIRNPEKNARPKRFQRQST